MKKQSILAFMSALLLSIQCFSQSTEKNPEKNIELWYKGLRTEPKTAAQKLLYGKLPTLYYTIGTLDDFEQKRIDPFNLKALHRGKKARFALDTAFPKRLIISDKKSPSIDDEVYVITTGPNKDVFVRFRLLEAQEKAPLSITLKNKELLFGPQSGKGLVAKKSESGYSLKNNVGIKDIDIQRKKIRDILPYVVPKAPPPPIPTPDPKEAPPEKKGIVEVNNRTRKAVYYSMNDTGKPLSKELKGTKILSGKTASGMFNNAKPTTMYVSPTPFKDLKEGQEVTFFEFPANKDLFVATEYHDGEFNLRAYFTCGTTIGVSSPSKLKRIKRCKTYGIESWQIKPRKGIHRGGVILKHTETR